MKKRTVEIQFGTNRLCETFLSWFEEDGKELFEDWVINFTDLDGDLEVDIDDIEDDIIRIDEN